jgi:hypothetical protein
VILEDNGVNVRGNGSHAQYHYWGDGLGAKVLHRGSLAEAQIEYLFNVYAHNEATTQGLTNEAVACGMWPVYKKEQVRPKPVIWLRHIQGVTCMRYATQLGWEHSGKFTETEAFTWGYECMAFKFAITRMTYICEALQAIGISCADHCENSNNFMLDEDMRITAIDFSFEKKGTPKAIREAIFHKHKERLQIVVPPGFD